MSGGLARLHHVHIEGELAIEIVCTGVRLLPELASA
jgi:hypothetical protein